MYLSGWRVCHDTLDLNFINPYLSPKVYIERLNLSEIHVCVDIRKNY